MTHGQNVPYQQKPNASLKISIQKVSSCSNSLSTYLLVTNLVLLINTKTVFSAILRSEIIRQKCLHKRKSFSKRSKSEFNDEKEVTSAGKQVRKESTKKG